MCLLRQTLTTERIFDHSDPVVSTEHTFHRYILFTTADTINLMLSLPTNVYVLWLIVTGGRGTVGSDFFALNLTVCDTFSCMSSLMFILHNRIYSPQVESGPLWETAIFFKGFILAGRPLFQCCICLERYVAVIHPVTFLLRKPLRYRVGCCVVVWLTVLGSCVAYFVCEYEYAMNNFTLGLIVVTFSVMLFCCLAVLRALKRPRPGEGDSDGMNNMKRRAFRIILMITVSMMIQYLPQVLHLTIYHFIELVEYNFGLSVSFFIMIVTGFVQPLLYLHRAGKLPCIRGP
ncbi:hypothetical protein DPEC_G00182230 [Dallia pectoralis]|uniref:Uncharacterized protein n=1 Tax=Dallia pectoralis TaxID=75939 RepID=A0ACC2GAG6_DALPE|nr:hypothetical protein DPEC_G00182230 [Dallia pectoralis]